MARMGSGGSQTLTNGPWQLMFDASKDGGPAEIYQVHNTHATKGADIKVEELHIASAAADATGNADPHHPLLAGQIQPFGNVGKITKVWGRRRDDTDVVVVGSVVKR